MCNYEVFLPEFIGFLMGKDRTPDSLDEGEIRGILAIAFRQAVSTFARETRTLRKQIPISLFKDARYYYVTPPDGFYVLEIEALLENAAPVPQGTQVGQRTITIPHCPPSDLQNAWYADVSVLPSLEECEVDEEYCVRYHDPIYHYMMHLLAGQKVRAWYSQEISDRSLGRYNELKDTVLREVINRTVDQSKGGVQLFLPAVLPGLTDERDKIRDVRETEVVSAITTAFRDTVIDVATETGLYQMQIPVSLFRETNYYPIEAPDGYHINKIDQILSMNANFPHNAIIGRGGFTLPCCPACDLENAYMVILSVIPTHDVCEFDQVFIDRYYDVILSGIKYRLHQQLGKQWSSAQGFVTLKQEYVKKIQRARRLAIGNPLRIRRTALSDYETTTSIPYPMCSPGKH